MADFKINLLPWREERREEKKQEFLQVLGAFVVVAVLIIGGLDRFYSYSTGVQKARNGFLTKEIKLLEDRILEINKLQKEKAELLARMRVIQDLQGNRPIIVRVFDELARQLPAKVFYTKMNLTGKRLTAEGIADSNNRISTQLRNFDESEWFEKPNVSAINADTAHGPQAAKFSLTVEQTTPKKEKES